MTGSKPAFDSKAYNEWVDAQRFPGETRDIALDRRIRGHKASMARGVAVGYDNETGKTVYTPPITLGDYPDCPWHGSECSAWIALQEGYDTEVVPDLRAEMVQARQAKKRQALVSRIMEDEGVDREVAEAMATRRSKRAKPKNLKFSVPVDSKGAFKPWAGKPVTNTKKVSETAATKAARSGFSLDFDAEIDEEGDEE